jgi:hypothetical protein
MKFHVAVEPGCSLVNIKAQHRSYSEPAQNNSLYFTNIHLNITLTLPARFPNWYFILKFPYQDFVWMPHFTCAWYISHLSWLYCCFYCAQQYSTIPNKFSLCLDTLHTNCCFFDNKFLWNVQTYLPHMFTLLRNSPKWWTSFTYTMQPFPTAAPITSISRIFQFWPRDILSRESLSHRNLCHKGNTDTKQLHLQTVCSM